MFGLFGERFERCWVGSLCPPSNALPSREREQSRALQKQRQHPIQKSLPSLGGADEFMRSR